MDEKRFREEKKNNDSIEACSVDSGLNETGSVNSDFVRSDPNDSNYYTKAETDARLALKADEEITETDTYTVDFSTPQYPDRVVTFKRLKVGVVTVNIYLPYYSSAQADIITNIPLKYRPDENLYFMGVDNTNAPRAAGILTNGNLRLYSGTHNGWYGTVSFVGREIEE